MAAAQGVDEEPRDVTVELDGRGAVPAVEAQVLERVDEMTSARVTFPSRTSSISGLGAVMRRASRSAAPHFAPRAPKSSRSITRSAR
jgi:hypothetical protein